MRLSEELRRRTKAFGSRVIRLFVQLPRDRDEVRVIGRQLLRSATSVAAQAREASRARSDAEFCSKLDILLQEADESQLWLEYLVEDCQVNHAELPDLIAESSELLAIFTTIVARLRRKS
jgi:four helix bundle protein